MEKTSTSYILPFDGEVIATKLSLIEVDNTAAETKAEKVSIQAEKVSVQTGTKSTDDGLTLTTKSYIDAKLPNIDATANEGQFLRVIDGKATWSTVPNAEDNAF